MIATTRFGVLHRQIKLLRGAGDLARLFVTSLAGKGFWRNPAMASPLTCGFSITTKGQMPALLRASYHAGARHWEAIWEVQNGCAAVIPNLRVADEPKAPRTKHILAEVLHDTAGRLIGGLAVASGITRGVGHGLRGSGPGHCLRQCHRAWRQSRTDWRPAGGSNWADFERAIGKPFFRYGLSNVGVFGTA